MSVNKQLKPFLRGWWELICHPFFDEDFLWRHLLAIVTIPFYPVLWMGAWVYCKSKE